MEKSRLWTQTEDALPQLHRLRLGNAVDKDLACAALDSLLPKVVSPKLRTAITTAVRKHKNDLIIAGMKAS